VLHFTVLIIWNTKARSVMQSSALLSTSFNEDVKTALRYSSSQSSADNTVIFWYDIYKNVIAISELGSK
jgi:hypothetical protein